MKSEYNETFNPQARMKDIEDAIDGLNKKFEIHIGKIEIVLNIGNDNEKR